MIDFSQARLEQVFIHHIGRRSEEEPVFLSQAPVNIEDHRLQEILQTYFLAPFQSEALYHFHHDTALNLNPVYQLSKDFFDQKSDQLQLSQNLANYLYEQSDHPRIVAGEFYVMYFRDCVFGDELIDAVGVYKTEHKDVFLTNSQQTDSYQVDFSEGINLKKIDKAALILNTEPEDGLRLCSVEPNSKSEETRYWHDRFLGLKAIGNHYSQTKNYLTMCKSFVQEVYNDENEVDKADQADLLNKSISYFKDNDTFEQNAFEQDVMMGEQQVVNQFNDYRARYQQENEVSFDDEFEVSQEAVKGQQRQFKSVLKLDRNFHVYIHGDRTRIVKGFDQARNLHFYQLFYDQEE